MKTQLICTFALLFLMSCTKNTNNTNNDQVMKSEEQGGESGFIEPSLIAELAGGYYKLQVDNGQIYFQESCKYITSDLEITESAEGSGEWNINHEGANYEIGQIENKEGDIHITTKAETQGMEMTFLFAQNENDLLWDFAEVGMKGISPVVKIQDLENFEIRPCTNVAENERAEVIGTMQLSFIQYLTYQGGIRAQIEAVRIRKDHRGKGLGTKMFKWAIERVKQRGAHLLQLTTDKKRPDALTFYESLGFVATHEGMKLHFL